MPRRLYPATGRFAYDCALLPASVRSCAPVGVAQSERTSSSAICWTPPAACKWLWRKVRGAGSRVQQHKGSVPPRYVSAPTSLFDYILIYDCDDVLETKSGSGSGCDVGFTWCNTLSPHATEYGPFKHIVKSGEIPEPIDSLSFVPVKKQFEFNCVQCYVKYAAAHCYKVIQQIRGALTAQKRGLQTCSQAPSVP